MVVTFCLDLKGCDHLQDRHRLWEHLKMDLREKGMRLTRIHLAQDGASDTV
jgi:hypothetical protein